MKKYVIRDSEGQKTTIYAKSITHALSYVENSKRVNDSKFYAEEDASEAKRRASKYGLQIKVGKKVSNGPNRGFDEIYYIGPKDKLTKMLKAEGFDDDEIIDMIEDSKLNDSINESRVKDEASSATIINALIEDEKSATEAYNVAISNLKDKIDAEALQVLINIRNDERRHIENLYSILNGNITEKNLKDSIGDAIHVADRVNRKKLAEILREYPKKQEPFVLQDIIDYYDVDSATGRELFRIWGYENLYNRYHFHNTSCIGVAY